MVSPMYSTAGLTGTVILLATTPPHGPCALDTIFFDFMVLGTYIICAGSYRTTYQVKRFRGLTINTNL